MYFKYPHRIPRPMPRVCYDYNGLDREYGFYPTPLAAVLALLDNWVSHPEDEQ